MSSTLRARLILDGHFVRPFIICLYHLSVPLSFVISFPTPSGVSGITYGAEWSTTLAPLDWTNIPDTGTLPQHTFSVPISSNTRMFTRLKVTSP